MDSMDYRAPEPVRPLMQHYHGDTTRVLFVVAAVGMLIAETFGSEMPFSPLVTVIFAVTLVIAAGITNPAQAWIHIANILISVIGALSFAPAAIGRYQDTSTLFDLTFFFTEALALLFLIATYFTVKTIRGILLRPNLF